MAPPLLVPVLVTLFVSSAAAGTGKRPESVGQGSTIDLSGPKPDPLKTEPLIYNPNGARLTFEQEQQAAMERVQQVYRAHTGAHDISAVNFDAAFAFPATMTPERKIAVMHELPHLFGPATDPKVAGDRIARVAMNFGNQVEAGRYLEGLKGLLVDAKRTGGDSTAVVAPAPLVAAFAAAGPTGQGVAAQLYADSNKPQQAVEMATKAIENGNRSPSVYLTRGQSADKLGDTELANSDARKVLALEPENKQAHSLFMLTRGRPSTIKLLDAGSLAADDGRLEAAGLDVSRPGWDSGDDSSRSAAEIAARENAAMNTSPAAARSVSLTEDARRALAARDPEAALRLTEQALSAEPRNVNAVNVRAGAFLQLGRYPEAVREASAGLQLVPDSGSLLYTRSLAYGRQKLWESAYADADAAVRNAPRSAPYYQARAGANWGLKRREPMLEDLRAAARLDARFRDDLQRAITQAEDLDPTLLFGEAPAQQAAAAPAAPSPLPRYALWGAGAVLAVLGLLPVFSTTVRRQVTTVLRRGPAEGELPGGDDALPPSAFWRRYDVTREIGAGGMGHVYEAWDKSLERRVAVKRMRDEIRGDRRERERFLQEARTVAQMRHPNLVEIYSIEEDGDDAYLVFEYVEGKTLHDLVSEKGALTPAEARDVFRGLCAGVEYAHRRGIVHRDLKPANVMVETDGAVKVMDFGVARQGQSATRQAMTNTVIGTLPYMAPEAEEGVVSAQSDVYALGVCLYEVLSGVMPFNGTAGAVLLAKRAAEYRPLPEQVPGLPAGVYALVDRALDPKPERRVQSAAEFYKELDAAVSVPA